MAGDGSSTPYRTSSQQSTRSPYHNSPTYRSNGHASYVDQIGDRLRSLSPSRHHDEIEERTPPGHNAQLLVPPNLDVLHQARASSNTMDFKAAAGRLYSTLCRAEKFFDVFLRSFKDEISQQYISYSKERLWRDKVIQYNQDLLLPNITGSEDTNNDYTHDDPTKRPQENESFKELQLQLSQQIVALCMSRIVPPKQMPEHQTAEANQQSSTTDLDLQFSSDEAVRLQVAYDMAKPLLQHVQTVHSKLVANLSRMHTDWRAACETLVMIKRLRGLMQEYRRAWKPLSNRESDERY
ncbi:hypothetical protein LTR05_000139 [Lithohypha guttulata]|uniref:Uncharacterized protein n=1 Tax=Lithohypha guttulata TaxID=1690604 RepID=A0AAN7YK28_9EURO|nr:hypothetical protein LTR05_000139 [Lithohypha guttulata]